MKHIHGLSITLLTTNTKKNDDQLIVEHAPSRTQQNALVRFNGQVGTRNISIPAGQSFKVVLDLDEDFKIYKATGIKITIVANDKNGKQRCGFWWLDVKAARDDDVEFVIDGFEGFGAAKGGKADFVMPEVDPDHAKATTSWVTADDYCANKSCVAVFVERGNFIEKDTVERRGVAAKRKRSKASQEPVAIQLEDFLPLASHNSNPYIFEFRNMQSLATAKPSRKSSVLIQDTEIFANSDIDIEYDTSDGPGAALPTEDEAEATDSEPSSSNSGSESDTGSYSVISDSEEDAYDYLYEGPKRKAAPARKLTSNKRQKTNAENNAEADAGNESFVRGGGNKKNADADATNASLGGLRLEDDRDDEELPCNVKPEPAFKQEKKVKTAGKGATLAPPMAKKRNLDDRDSDSAYSSEEEIGDEDTTAVKHVKRPRVAELLEGVRATLNGLSGGKKVVSARQGKGKGGK